MDWSDIKNVQPGLYRVFWKSGQMGVASCGKDSHDNGGTWIAIANRLKPLMEGDKDYFRIVSQIEKLEWIDEKQSASTGVFCPRNEK